MSLSPYRAVLRRRAVRHLLLLGVVARVPMTAAGIVLVLHVQSTLGRSWLEAGLVGATTTVGAAIGSPWRGRLVDRFGLRRALAPSIVVEALVWGTIPWLPYEGLLVAAFVGGLMGLPIFTVVRQSLSVLVPEAQRRTAYAVDSIGVELSFMAGPGLGVLAATQLSTGWALVGVGVATVASGLLLAAADPPTRSEQLAGRRVGADVDRADSVSRHAPVAAAAAERTLLTTALRPAAAAGRRTWMTPSLLAVLVATAGATLVLYGTDLGVVAVLRGADAVELSWLVFAAWGAGSITGGLVYGGARRGVHPLWLLLALGLLTVPIGLATSPWVLCLAILPAGALCAPVVSATAEAVARLVPEHSRGEAMGWHASALTVGGALGGPLAGTAIDAVGPWGGFALVGGLGAVVAVAALGVQQARRRAPAPASVG
ncbi:MAG: MFS transporter [Actinomycetes bacterium]